MRRAVPLLLAVLLLAFGFAELDQYGVTWDEALGDLFFGDRYASYFASFDERYLDFSRDPYPPGHVPNLFVAEFRTRPWEHYPVASTLGSVTSRLFFGRLGVLDPFDGFHAVNLILGALLLVVLYRFIERNVSMRSAAVPAADVAASRAATRAGARDAPASAGGDAGAPAAIVSTLLLFLMPRVVADLMANPKDIPEMVFFSLTLIAFFAAYERGSALGIAASGLLWGLALGTKANAMFLPFVIVAFLFVRGLPDAWRDRKAKLFGALAAAAMLAFALLVASWPWLWDAPIERLLMNLKYVALRSKSPTTVHGWLSAVLLTTPPAMLVLLLAAIPGVVRRAKAREPFTLMLLCWIGVIVARLSIPGAVNFDGVRHFLELFPPLAALAGIAAVEWTQRLTSAPRSLRVALLALPIVTIAWATIVVHPFETVYWNTFAGGYSGARARHIAQASDYWAASYRHGLRWMNEHAPKDSILVVPIAGHTVAMVAPLRLRPDIRLFVPRRVSLEDALQWGPRLAPIARRRPVYLMFVLRDEWRTPLDVDAERRLVPAAAWHRDDAPVLLIYRL